MEFLRFGGRINGRYWGCCAVDVIQDFSKNPDEPASIQFVYGDSGVGNGKFLGVTYKDIFLTRLRIGTHSATDKKCRGFLAVITANQLRTETGTKWLAILKENGFEFIRTIHNSVYGETHCHPNYLFGLFRNIGAAAVVDPFTPPPGWDDLPKAKSQEELWDEGKSVFFTEKELREKDVPVTLAGKAGTQPAIKPEEGQKAPPVYDPYAAYAGVEEQEEDEEEDLPDFDEEFPQLEEDDDEEQVVAHVNGVLVNVINGDIFNIPN